MLDEFFWYLLRISARQIYQQNLNTDIYTLQNTLKRKLRASMNEIIRGMALKENERNRTGQFDVLSLSMILAQELRVTVTKTQ